VDEMTDVDITGDLLLIIWNWNVLWIVLINPFSPDLLVSVDSIWELLEEEGVVVSELVLGKSLKVQPSFLLHPVEWLVSVFNTSTAFKEHADISVGEFTILDQDLGGHHEFEGNLIGDEKTSIDVSVNFLGKLLGDIVHSLFDELSFS
jgi:hypothetical protein